MYVGGNGEYHRKCFLSLHVMASCFYFVRCSWGFDNGVTLQSCLQAPPHCTPTSCMKLFTIMTQKHLCLGFWDASLSELWEHQWCDLTSWYLVPFFPIKGWAGANRTHFTPIELHATVNLSLTWMTSNILNVVACGPGNSLPDFYVPFHGVNPSILVFEITPLLPLRLLLSWVHSGSHFWSLSTTARHCFPSIPVLHTPALAKSGVCRARRDVQCCGTQAPGLGTTGLRL